MDNIKNTIQNSSCYIHVYASGKILYIPASVSRGYLCDLAHVLNELEYVQSAGGILFYSLADDQQPESPGFTTAVDAIMDLGLETQMINPHPQVYNYYKSFVPYFNEALEAAAMDVSGLIVEIQLCEARLNDLDLADNDFAKTVELLEELKGRYYLAKNALDKLSSLHFTLCVKTEQGDL